MTTQFGAVICICINGKSGEREHFIRINAEATTCKQATKQKMR